MTVIRPLRLLVSVWFQFCFTPLTGVLFTFPSRYLFTIGMSMYLAFPVSSGRFTQAIHVPGYSGTIEERFIVFVYGTITLYGRAFQRIPLTITLCNFLLSLSTRFHCPPTPHLSKIGAVWATPFSLAATQRISLLKAACFPFLWVLRCFTSPSLLRTAFTAVWYSSLEWVSPFGNLRLIGCISPRRSLSQICRVLHRH